MRVSLKTKKIYESFKENLIGFIIIGFFIYFIYVAFSGNTESDKTKAWVLVKHEVENRLKSPSTAKFSSMNNASIIEEDGLYIISSYVDAENSFGAKVRSNFTAILKKTSSGDYFVESIDIDN